MKNRWFEVDKQGLRNLVERQGIGRLIAELVQNALDEDVTIVAVQLLPLPGRPLVALAVEDDAPEGFRNLDHAFTLFADSYKKSLPEKRGRFNLGEKLILAMCQEATIATTTGSVMFGADGDRHVRPRSRRERGSMFQADLRMSRAECDETCIYLHSLLIPNGVTVTLNGVTLSPRQPIHTFDANLETEIADDERVLRRRMRKTSIELYEPLVGETATLYELGLPVVETGDRWHLNVAQKVPLTLSRDNVPPAYLRNLRTFVLNEMHDRLTTEDVNTVWVQQATCDDACSPEAIRTFLDRRFGDHRAAYDPTDPEANKAIQADGGTIITSRMLKKEQWQKAKEAGAIHPAGKIKPTAKPYSLDPNAPSADVILPADWTNAMRTIASYAVFLAKELMDVDLIVMMVRTTNNFAACYGQGRLDLNLFRLGHRWFEQGASESVDALLLHEFGHEFSGDHLSSDFHDALCRLGARLKRLALEKPEAFRAFTR
ncbi:MAG: hypothetical protein HYX68_27090 [Planctomycetes bacterium]|nr:hypothetical protein [Planctomycetota bacterium]